MLEEKGGYRASVAVLNLEYQATVLGGAGLQDSGNAIALMLRV